MAQPKIAIRRKDTVEVIAGKDKGKRGKVLKVFPEKRRVLVEGVNFIKKHQRANQRYKEGGVVEREGLIQVSNLMVVCPKCDRPSRLGSAMVSETVKARICRRCEEPLERG